MVFSQKKDIVEESFEVNGVCKMCKARIEKTAFKQKGVKNAEWDINNHLLTVLYDKSKLDIYQIHKYIYKRSHIYYKIYRNNHQTTHFKNNNNKFAYI